MVDDRIDDERARRNSALDGLGKLIDGIVVQECVRHYDALTQEHQFTSKLAGAVERELAGTRIDGCSVDVSLQDTPDKGPGSLERKIGADLYISVVLQSDDEEHPVSKGILVQAKWDRTLSIDGPDTRRQLSDMLHRSRASHVWVYSRSGVVSIPAADFMQGKTAEHVTTPGQLIADGLKCTEGDQHIGRDLGKPLVQSLNEIIREIAARKALSLRVRFRRRRLRLTRGLR